MITMHLSTAYRFAKLLPAIRRHAGETVSLPLHHEDPSAAQLANQYKKAILRRALPAIIFRLAMTIVHVRVAIANALSHRVMIFELLRGG